MSGGPKWLTSDRFDIVAKAEEGASPTQLPSMLQALLTDRFKLAVHHETKELPIYALALARTDGTLGSHLRRNDCERILAALDPSQPHPCGSISNGLGRLSFRGGSDRAQRKVRSGSRMDSRSAAGFQGLGRPSSGHVAADQWRPLRPKRTVRLHGALGAARPQVGIDQRASRCPCHRPRRAADIRLGFDAEAFLGRFRDDAGTRG